MAARPQSAAADGGAGKDFAQGRFHAAAQVRDRAGSQAEAQADPDEGGTLSSVAWLATWVSNVLRSRAPLVELKKAPVKGMAVSGSGRSARGKETASVQADVRWNPLQRRARGSPPSRREHETAVARNNRGESWQL